LGREVTILSNWKLKHRPQTIEEFVGNSEMVEAIISDSSGEDKERSYLLYGPHGIGKTTLARIIAKVYLKVDDFNINEINASSDNGVDMARYLEEMCGNATPVNRVWILDEFHNSTKAAQNALLKLLEEGSDKDFFFLCTTETKGIIPTIKSRCGKYPLELPSDLEIKKRLRVISRSEETPVSPEVIKKILEKAEGHVRDAVGFLQSVHDMEESKATKYLDKCTGGEAGSPAAFDLIKELIYTSGRGAPNITKVKRLLKELKEVGEAPEGLRRFILSAGSNELLKNWNLSVALILQNFEDPYYDAPTAWPIFILDCFRALNDGSDDIPF
jgi:DNA polymerase-3 subunit gamma/tau